MVKKINIKEKISESFDLPKDVILDAPNINIIGNNEINIENHKGIIEYTQEILRVNSSLGAIKITGSGLLIKEISKEEVHVSGKIISIEFIS